MTLYLILVYVHLLCAIFWVGYTLYWFYVVSPLHKEPDERRGKEIIQLIDRAVWPPPSLPSPIRLSFSSLGAVSIAVLVLTGFGMLFLRGFTLHDITSGHLFQDGLGRLGLTKVFLVAVMVFVEYSSKQRTVLQSRIVFSLALLIAGMSVLLVR